MDLTPEKQPELTRESPEVRRSEAAQSKGSSSSLGRAYSPPPSSETVEQTDPGGSRRNTIGIAIVLAVAIGGSALLGYATRQVPPPGVSVAAADEQSKTLRLGSADIDVQATEQLKLMLAGETTASVDLKATNSPALAAIAKSPEVADDVRSGRRVLYRITVLDFLDQDGDHIEFFADGFSLGDIALENAGKSILVPLIPGKPTTFTIKATVDGGGGVTVGFVSTINEARTDFLQVGQSETWQVTVQ